jgi:hypothetical protein
LGDAENSNTDGAQPAAADLPHRRHFPTDPNEPVT